MLRKVMAETSTKSKLKVVKSQTAPGPILIKMPDLRLLKVTVVGTSPLVCHAWGSKLDKLKTEQDQKDSGTSPKRQRKKRNPEAEMNDAMHWLPGKKPAIPAIAFKRAMVGACRYVEGLDMTYAKGIFFVLGDLLPIKGAWRMRTDPARVPPRTGNADIRYRPEFPKWEVDLVIQYNANLINSDQLLNLLMLAGFHQGVLEMRPSAREKPFNFGMFTIKASIKRPSGNKKAKT